jgi:hypothetical protein
VQQQLWLLLLLLHVLLLLVNADGGRTDSFVLWLAVGWAILQLTLFGALPTGCSWQQQCNSMFVVAAAAGVATAAGSASGGKSDCY